MSSGLQAGKNFPVPVTNPDEQEHRRWMAEAINHLAAAVYTPQTQFAEIEDVDLAATPADLGLLLSVTPFIPARAHVLLVFQVTNGHVSDDGDATFEIYENDTVIADAETFVAASGGGADQFVVMQALRDLEPNTTYSYTVDGTEAPDGAILIVYGSLTVRVEHRKIT